MRHGIYQIVDAEPVCQGRHRFWIAGIIGMFPCVTHVHIEVDGDHEPPLVVVDTRPALWAIKLCLSTSVSRAVKMALAWYLPLLILTTFRPNLEDRVAPAVVR